MANLTNNVSFPESIRMAVNNVLNEANTCLPGRIVKVLDYKKRKISVQPEIKREFLDGEVLTPPIIENVPLAFYGSTDAILKIPIKIDDKVILLFSQRSMDRWLDEGELTTPGYKRKYNLTDCIAVPCIQSFKSDHPLIDNNDDTELIFNDSKIIIKPDGDIQVDSNSGKVIINNAVEDLAKLMEDLLDEIIGLVTVGSPSTHNLNPASIANFTAIKVRLGNLLKES